mmetsp:Transcript_29707/g.65840  ORF Transcript_29707/g.65840 Transcript_29707/m.65840 type:complete len:228 (+) Transcript_29707:325-1008(+)
MAQKGSASARANAPSSDMLLFDRSRRRSAAMSGIAEAKCTSPRQVMRAPAKHTSLTCPSSLSTRARSCAPLSPTSMYFMLVRVDSTVMRRSKGNADSSLSVWRLCKESSTRLRWLSAESAELRELRVFREPPSSSDARAKPTLESMLPGLPPLPGLWLVVVPPFHCPCPCPCSACSSSSLSARLCARRAGAEGVISADAGARVSLDILRNFNFLSPCRSFIPSGMYC